MPRPITYIIIGICCISGYSGFSQIGISTQYLIQDFPNLEMPHANNNAINTQVGFGLSYWFRMKKVRWEITPTLYYHQGSGVDNDEGADFSQSTTSLHIQNNFYLADFKNDCMCPTFSKQGEWIRKGFFIYAAPGFGSNQFKLNEIKPEAQFYVYGEIGMGMDFGLTNVFTLTPSLGYRQLFNQGDLPDISIPSSHNQLVGNLKLTFRWDKENFYRRR